MPDDRAAASTPANSRADSAPLRIGIAGFWHVHASDYARAAQAYPDVELVGGWDPDEARGREGTQAFGIDFVADLDDLLAHCDGVVITTATSEHVEIMTRIAAADRHMFTEKVVASTVAGCTEIIAAADANDVRLVVSLPRLNHGYTRGIRDVLAEGRLGRVTYGRVRLGHDGATAGWLPERFFAPEETLGGALIDLGCHPVYLTQLFLGAAPETVSATYGSVTGHQVEDNAVVTVGYPGGTIGVIETGFAGFGTFRIELTGTEGALSYDAGSGLVLETAAGRESLSLPEDRPDAFSQWIEHIRSGTRADENLARAVELTRLLVAAEESARTGRTVDYRESGAVVGEVR